MSIQVNNIKVPLETSLEEVVETGLKKLSKTKSECLDFRILKQSVDARKKNVSFVYSVLFHLKNEKNIKKNGDILFVDDKKESHLIYGNNTLTNRPIVVGAGPAGLFCALTLARNGYSPILIERGGTVEERTQKVKNFWQNKVFDAKSNVQFGEGGAGTFSDGKLTTRINDKKIDDVLCDFIKHGADSDIRYKAKPHIGTDVLSEVVKNIRNEIIALGGEVRFGTQLLKIHQKSGCLSRITLSDGSELETEALCLAIGHSARDTYEMLFNEGIDMILKPFSVGVRIEHLRDDIDKAMYGDFAGHPALGAAPYQLAYKNGDDRCYSFCMCPGGVVVQAASEEETVVTNGMSYRARNEINSNAALCVNVDEKDFGSSHPLSGIRFQQKLENEAFITGGKNYCAPAQKFGDFKNGKKTTAFGKIKPTFSCGVTEAGLSECLPSNVSRILSDAISYFGTKINGYDSPDSVLTGTETRTSAPVRILRDENGESTSLKGLYPCGEGAGYAGGIMSAAVDGINIAEKIMEKYKPFR